MGLMCSLQHLLSNAHSDLVGYTDSFIICIGFHVCIRIFVDIYFILVVSISASIIASIGYNNHIHAFTSIAK